MHRRRGALSAAVSAFLGGVSSRVTRLHLRPTVSQRHRAIEYQRTLTRIRIADEIPRALELIASTHRLRAHARLDLRASHHHERGRIDHVEEILSLWHLIRIGYRKQLVVQP